MKKSTLVLKRANLLILLIISCWTAHSQSKLIGLSKVNNRPGAVFSMIPGDTDFSAVYQFPATSGHTPCGSLIKGSNNKLYGMTTYGGSPFGNIFEYDYLNDKYNSKFAFQNATGSYPFGSLLKASNDKFYGLTFNGGLNNLGVLFEYDYLNNVYTKKVDLALATGSKPTGSLIEVSNGKLYGVTPAGGLNNSGVIFEYDINSNTYTKKFDFTGTDGKPSNSSLLLASNGKLYGTTNTGGTNNGGVIFEYDYVNNVYTKKFDFQTPDGANPTGSLMLANNGKMYGLATTGGANNKGVLFEFDYLNNIYTKKIDLNAGVAARGELIQASNGRLYGLSSELFEYDISNNIYTPKITLTPTTGAGSTYGGLLEAPDGKLYGLTTKQGQPLNTNPAVDNGTLFSYDINQNVLSKKLMFDSPIDGNAPYGKLLAASNGKVYGTTATGGLHNMGTIFEYDRVNNVARKIYDLYNDVPGRNGSESRSTLIEVNGKFYGITAFGGTSGFGTIFEFDPLTHVYTKKIDFNATIGSHPANLVLAPNGKMYGNIDIQGTSTPSLGIFEYDLNSNTCVKKIDFPYSPSATSAMLLANNGKLYCTINRGTGGLLMEYDYVTNTLQAKIDFGTQLNFSGVGPTPMPMQATDGKIYGMVAGGVGTNAGGVLYQYDPVTNAFVVKVQFDATTGNVPEGSLVQASNGKLYGTTSWGGSGNNGSLFEYDPVLNVLTVKKYQNSSGGRYDMSFIEVPDAACTVTANITNNTGTTILNCSTNVINVTATGGLSYSWDHALGNNANAVITAPGTYTVIVTAAGGCTDTESITVTQQNIAPVLSPISGLTNVCSYIGTPTQLTYSVMQDPNATSYQWTVPPTVTLLSGQGTNSITVTINSNFANNLNRVIKVKALSLCGATQDNLLYLLAQLPSTPGLITASSTNVCAAISNNSSITYSIAKVNAASSYTWLAQIGTTSITHPNGPGANDTLIIVNFTDGFTSSAITVQAINDCGTSGTRSFTITRNNPQSPGLISGPINACEFIAPNGIPANYSVPNIAGNTYNWTLPAGAISITGQGSNSISFIFPAGFTNGSISVTTSNACGTSAARTLNITKLNPSNPGNIGSQLIQDCPQRIYSYSIPLMPSNATSITWTVPNGATIISGQGGITITVSYPSTAVTGFVTAQAISNCGNSSIRTFNLALPACIAGFAKTVSKTVEAQKPGNAKVIATGKVYPNPTNNSFQLQLSAYENSVVEGHIMDVQGKEIQKIHFTPGKITSFGNELKAGMYLLTLKLGDRFTVQKLLKL